MDRELIEDAFAALVTLERELGVDAGRGNARTVLPDAIAAVKALREQRDAAQRAVAEERCQKT
jgi:hypothetical protein